jgi:hypothetical protein
MTHLFLPSRYPTDFPDLLVGIRQTLPPFGLIQNQHPPAALTRRDRSHQPGRASSNGLACDNSHGLRPLPDLSVYWTHHQGADHATQPWND